MMMMMIFKKRRSILLFTATLLTITENSEAYNSSGRREKEEDKNNIFVEDYIRENIKEAGVINIGKEGKESFIGVTTCEPIIDGNAVFFGTMEKDSNSNIEVDYTFEIAVDNSLNDISSMLLSVEGAVMDELLPELFPEACRKDRRKRRRLENGEKGYPGAIVGISSVAKLPVIKSIDCDQPDVNCFRVKDGFTIFTADALGINQRNVLEDKVLETISTGMKAGDFNNAHSSIAKLAFVNSQEGKSQEGFQIKSTTGSSEDDDEEDMTMTIAFVIVAGVVFIILAEIIRRRATQDKGKIDGNDEGTVADDESVQVERKLRALLVDEGLAKQRNGEEENLDCQGTDGTTSADNSGEVLFRIAEAEDEDENKNEDEETALEVPSVGSSTDSSKLFMEKRPSKASIRFGRSVRFKGKDESVRFDDVKWGASKSSLNPSKEWGSSGQSFSSGKGWDSSGGEDAFKSGKGWDVSEWTFNSGRESDKTEPTLSSNDEDETGSETGFKISKVQRPSILLNKAGPSTRFDGVNESIRFSKGWDMSERTLKSIKSGMGKSLRSLNSIKGRPKSQRKITSTDADNIPLAEFDEQQFDDDFPFDPFGTS